MTWWPPRQLCAKFHHVSRYEPDFYIFSQDGRRSSEKIVYADHVHYESPRQHARFIGGNLFHHQAILMGYPSVLGVRCGQSSYTACFSLSSSNDPVMMMTSRAPFSLRYSSLCRRSFIITLGWQKKKYVCAERVWTCRRMPYRHFMLELVFTDK